MSGPTSRVLALLELLQAGGTHTASALARRLEVDERTVRRYVEQLVELEVPVWSTRGRHGGYRLAPGYRMPPLMLTDDESVAVLLGLLAASGTALGAASEQATSSAIAKIRRVLPKPLAARVDALLETVELTVAGSDHAPQPELLLAIAGAARAQQPVALSYVDRHGAESRRTIEPYGIVAHSGRWYVLAADAASGEERSFRLDRITRATAQASTFTRPDDLDLQQRFLRSLATAPYRHDITVIVDGTLADVRVRLPASVALLEQLEPPGRGVRVRIRAERLDWVPGLLVGLDRPFRVEGPEELRALLRRVATRLGTAARDAPDDVDERTVVPRDSQPGPSAREPKAAR